MFHTGGKENALLQVLPAHHALSRVVGLAGVLTTYALSYQPGPPLTGQLASPRSPEWAQTINPCLNGALLYQLSY